MLERSNILHRLVDGVGGMCLFSQSISAVGLYVNHRETIKTRIASRNWKVSFEVSANDNAIIFDLERLQIDVRRQQIIG